MFHATVSVTLRSSILDPQGKAVEHGIHSLGFNAVANVRMGKLIEMDVDAVSEAEARHVAEEVARKLLANPVMEDFRIVITATERTVAS